MQLAGLNQSCKWRITPWDASSTQWKHRVQVNSEEVRPFCAQVGLSQVVSAPHWTTPCLHVRETAAARWNESACCANDPQELLTSAAGRGGSAQPSAGPPGPSSSSSYGPWSSGSGWRQTSSRPFRSLWKPPAWSPSGGCVCSLGWNGIGGGRKGVLVWYDTIKCTFFLMDSNLKTLVASLEMWT